MKPLTSRMRWAIMQLNRYGNDCAVDPSGNLNTNTSLLVIVERRTWMDLEKRGLVRLELKHDNLSASRRIYYIKRVQLTVEGLSAALDIASNHGKDADA